MSKMKGFGFTSIADQLLYVIRDASIIEAMPVILNNFLFEYEHDMETSKSKVVKLKRLVNDETLRREIQGFLSRVYEGKYLIRCSEIENTADVIDAGIVAIYVAGLDEKYIVKFGADTFNVTTI